MEGVTKANKDKDGKRGEGGIEVRKESYKK
jgi:hypothetical protein